MVAFITLTNTGYIDYTLNCLKSLENIKSKINLHCYCIGEEGHKLLIEKGYKSTLIDSKENSNFQEYRKGNWASIVSHKFQIIYENLLINDYLLITDGDIVFEKDNFIDYLLKNIGNSEMLIQNDTLSDSSNTNLCSGFIFLKSNKNTINLFNPKNIEIYKKKTGWGDQDYLNEIKNKMQYKKLPLELFPNGKYYYSNYNKINPYIIHFNWVVGNEKKKRMITFKKWYLS
jgi:hypothetical protein